MRLMRNICRFWAGNSKWRNHFKELYIYKGNLSL
jgi:hypothetical protein